ncbi:hypothetical protein [Nitrolancea hollandica]|uniref:hypothetical protein n=1 Tax=Nitrolancea hollandica TaxID=1206749 RepID=UPI00135F10AE|nr:hypothetical protein [Nitrolancea hollandica]
MADNQTVYFVVARNEGGEEIIQRHRATDPELARTYANKAANKLRRWPDDDPDMPNKFDYVFVYRGIKQRWDRAAGGLVDVD